MIHRPGTPNPTRTYRGIEGVRRGRSPGGSFPGVFTFVVLMALAAVILLSLSALLGDAARMVRVHGPGTTVALAILPAALAVWVAYDRNNHRRKAWRRWKPVLVTASTAAAALVAVEMHNDLFSTALRVVLA